MYFTRRALAMSAVRLAAATSACSKDSTTAPSAPAPIVGVSVVAKSISSIQISFTSMAGDVSYDIERAEGATGGTFTAVTNIPAPATAPRATTT